MQSVAQGQHFHLKPHLYTKYCAISSGLYSYLSSPKLHISSGNRTPYHQKYAVKEEKPECCPGATLSTCTSFYSIFRSTLHLQTSYFGILLFHQPSVARIQNFRYINQFLTSMDSGTKIRRSISNNNFSIKIQVNRIIFIWSHLRKVSLIKLKHRNNISM